MTTPSLTVEVQVQGIALPQVQAIAPKANWSAWIGDWLHYMSPQFSPIGAYEVSLTLTDDAEIAALNAQYRQRDRPTDVLAFPAIDAALPVSAAFCDIPYPLGDIVISVTTAQRQCDAHGHTLVEELAWLAAHGFLHLLGWDHPDDQALQQMWSMQATLLAQAGVGLATSAYRLSGA